MFNNPISFKPITPLLHHSSTPITDRSGAKLRLLARAILISTTLTLLVMEICQGYVMPAEQIIQIMAKNFSKFETLVITQTTQQQDPTDDEWEEVFMEKIWMKSPHFFRSKVLDETGSRALVPGIDYRQLLIANDEQQLMELLSEMGINLLSVGFTRINGIIAYRIGDKEPESPRLFIEKERFLPLVLKYRLPGDSTLELITVRFEDYRKLDQGWYPFEMTYSYSDEIIETHTIHTLDANVPINPALFDVSETASHSGAAREKGLSPLEEERLKRIIKTFEEKYR